MRKSEIRKLIDTDKFLLDIDEMVQTYGCTFLGAIEEYARLHDIDLDIMADIVKSQRGTLRSKLTEECVRLNLVEAVE